MQKLADKSIFKRLRAGEQIPMNDPEYSQIGPVVNRTRKLVHQLNQAEDASVIRTLLGQITETEIAESTVLFPPFHTNVGVNIKLGKNVFINHACSFLDLGGIRIEDHVMIGPRVNITSENHPVDPLTRKTMVPGAVLIQENAWIGAGATILPGVTVGKNAVVAAGAVVTKDVPPNTVVAGVPAKVVKQLS